MQGIILTCAQVTLTLTLSALKRSEDAARAWVFMTESVTMQVSCLVKQCAKTNLAWNWRALLAEHAMHTASTAACRATKLSAICSPHHRVRCRLSSEGTADSAHPACRRDRAAPLS